MKESGYHPNQERAEREPAKEGSFSLLLDFAYEKLGFDKSCLAKYLESLYPEAFHGKCSWKYEINSKEGLKITIVREGFHNIGLALYGKKARIYDKENKEMKSIIVGEKFRRPRAIRNAAKPRGRRGYGPDDFGAGPGRHIADED